MKRFLKFVCIIGVILMIASCGKEIDVFTEDPQEGAMVDFLTSVQTFSETFTINSDEESFIETENGNLIKIPAAAFQNSTNITVTGNIEFEILEILNKSILTLYEVNMVSLGNLLDSEVVYYFQASQNGERILLNDKKIDVYVAQSEINETAEMYGKAGKSFADEWQKDFEHIVTTGQWVVKNLLTGQIWSDFGYTYQVGSLGWKSCAFKMESPNTINQICATLPEAFEANVSNTKVYLIFEDNDCVVLLNNSNNGTQYCSELGLIPDNTNVTIVSLNALGNDNYYIHGYATVTNEGLNVNLAPERKTKEQILDILEMF